MQQIILLISVFFFYFSLWSLVIVLCRYGIHKRFLIAIMLVFITSIFGILLEAG